MTKAVKTRMRAPTTPRGVVLLPEEAIDPRMFRDGFQFSVEWLGQDIATAARLAVRFFEMGEPEAIVQLARAKCPIPDEQFRRLGELLFFSGEAALRNVAGATRKTTGAKRKEFPPALASAVKELYEASLAATKATPRQDRTIYPLASDRAADEVAAMPALRWLRLTRSGVKRLVSKARKAAARKNAP